MTAQEEKDLRAYSAFILKEYGFHISPNDPVIPALYIIHREMQLNNQNNQAIASQIKDATQQINPKVFQFNHPGESWKYQLGIAFKWMAFGLLLLMLGGLITWYWSMANDVNQARAIVRSSSYVSELTGRTQKDKDGCYFIDFTAAKGDSILFLKEFKKINPRTVRVYLGKQ